MTNYDAASGAGTLRLIVTLASQNVATNTSYVNWELHLICGNGVSNSYTPIGWAAYIGASYATSGSYTFDFSLYSDKLIASGTNVPIVHDANGTKTISVTGYTNATGTGAIGGPINTTGSYVLPTIPRATQPTVSPTSGNTAVAYTIGHTPATSSFYHDVAYSLDSGGSYTNIATNVVGTTTSTSWTPAHSLLPNSTGVTAIIRVITRATSGGTIIGTKTVNLPLTVPASVKPTISAVTWADGRVSAPNMPTLMGAAGRFVQGWSKLIPTVTSSGASGSTITDTDVIQNGQTTNSGVAFTNAVALSGSVPFTTYAYDSRGRTSDPYTNTVTVKAYGFPNLPTPIVTRTSDAAGTIPAPTGTYIAITPNASTSSLNFSGEKNLLEWQIRVRPVGGSYTTVQAWTATSVVGTTWTTKKVIGTYASSSEWEVEVSIRDLFGKNGYNSSNTIKTVVIPVASESVALDWDQGLGVGIGEYRRSGKMLSVAGQISQNGGLNVIDTSNAATSSTAGIAPLASTGEAQAGVNTTKIITPARMWEALGVLLPPGMILPAALSTSPTGFLRCVGSAVSRTTYADLFAAINPVVGNFTITIAAPGLATLTAHGLSTGDQVFVNTTGALPTGLTSNTVNYWVIYVSANTFRLATSQANALAGTAITTTGSQSGTHTITRTWGVGNGSTTFNVPDFRGSSPFGVDSGQTEFAAVGLSAGTKSETLTIAQMPAHTHPVNSSNGGAVNNALGVTSNSNGDKAFAAPGAIATSTGGGGSHNNLPPYVAVNFYIKT